MKVSRLHIKHFKSLEDVSLNCEDMVSLIGENNPGKSNVMDALDLFLDPSVQKVTEESFYEKDAAKPIEITVEFKGLNEWETEYFSKWIAGQKLVIRRRVQWTTSPKIVNVEVARTPEPEWLRDDHASGEKVDQWCKYKEQLVVAGIRFSDYLGSKKPTVREWKDAIARLLAEHKEEIPWIEVEKEDPTGYANVLKGGLPQFIMVPAVRYASEETKVAKTNPFGHLINTLLSRIPEDSQKEITEAVGKIQGLVNRAESRDRLPEIKEIENLLRTMLCHFTDCDIEIEFPLPEFDDLFRGARIYVNDGFRTSLEAKGHGMQRSVIFAILRAYAELLRKGQTAETKKNRSVLFAIEEPELYLHPQAQRIMMHLLRQIAEGQDQVIYSTHSSHFVDIVHFDEICLIRREAVDGHWKTLVKQLSMNSVIQDLKTRYPSTSPTPVSIQERYYHVYSSTRSEGFFARKVIVVEGPTEEYSLPIYSQALGYDMDKEGTSVINSGGKGQISKLFTIFNEFRIPSYVVFDGDKSNRDHDNIKATLDLLQFFGSTRPVSPSTTVDKLFAVFEEEFETTLKQEVPDYDDIAHEAKKLLGLKKETGGPLIARYMARKLVQKGVQEGDPSRYVPPTIKQIVEKVKELKWECSVLKC